MKPFLSTFKTLTFSLVVLTAVSACQKNGSGSSDPVPVTVNNNPPVNPVPMPIPGGQPMPYPYPGGVNPSTGDFNSQFVSCQVQRQRNSDTKLFGIIPVSSQSNSALMVSMFWNKNQQDSLNLPGSLFSNSGKGKLELFPARDGQAAQIKLSFSKKSDSNEKMASKTVSIQGDLDQGVMMRVFDESDQREVVINCNLSGQTFQRAMGATLSCDGVGKTATGEKFKFTQSYPINNQPLNDLIELGKNSDAHLTLQSNGSGAILNLNIRVSQGEQDLSVDTNMSIANGLLTYQQKELDSGFALDLKCKLK